MLKIWYRYMFISLLLLILIFSCKKDDNFSYTTYDKYIIEMNNDYKIFRISHYQMPSNSSNIAEMVLDYTQDYTYSDNYITNYATYISSGRWGKRIYFLNTIGLADSCFYINDSQDTSRIQYLYSNSYLISSKVKGGATEYYEYLDGNRTKAVMGSLDSGRGMFYTYNSIINKIDIESLKGPFLGKLSKNLISKSLYMGPNGSSRSTTNYQYRLNNEGLVVQKIEICTDAFGEKTKETTSFEYLFSFF